MQDCRQARFDPGGVLIQLAITLAGTERPDVVFSRTLATLASAYPGVRWVLIERKRANRYRAWAQGSWSNADLRLLLDRAVGAEARLCSDRPRNDNTDHSAPMHIQWQVARSLGTPRYVQLVLGASRSRGHYPLNQETLGQAVSLIAGHLKAARLLDELVEQSTCDPGTRSRNGRTLALRPEVA